MLYLLNTKSIDLECPLQVEMLFGRLRPLQSSSRVDVFPERVCGMAIIGKESGERGSSDSQVSIPRTNFLPLPLSSSSVFIS